MKEILKLHLIQYEKYNKYAKEILFLQTVLKKKKTYDKGHF